MTSYVLSGFVSFLVSKRDYRKKKRKEKYQKNDE